ncbi:PAS domain S-box protein [Cylindrospermum sp. FACHB-282]|uniref:PAS domain S-box protein n=1 Tax=Cylindrospermum sp. FACHB-282 TaxID=2692794 RepID=UPI0016851F30|nr:PAS domain S-box protein [Cylindrospermum sp. FACHB-282]MBD2384970.1 PAS domain S-box protein [Cylindrospermum sp. FACHB-282]
MLNLNVNRLWRQYLHKLTGHLSVVAVTSMIAILVGSLVLVGWCFDIVIIKSGFPGSSATMKADTAICLLVSGISLWLLQRGVKQIRDSPHPSAGNSPVTHVSYLRLSRVCAIAVVIISGLTVIQYSFGWNFGIDEMLFRDSPIVVTTTHPGRMGLNTAINFMLISVALYLLGRRKSRRSYWYAQFLALTAALISLQALIGYAYTVKGSYGIQFYTTSMALHTVLSFLVLCIGILWLHPDQALMRVVMSDTYGGLLARRLLLPAIVVPFVTGWLMVLGHDAGLFETDFAISLFAIVLIVIFAILVWQSATVIERLSHQRDRAQEALRVNEEKLRAFVDSNIIGIVFADVYGGVQQANNEFLRMIGYTREDMLAGKIRLNEMTPPEFQPLEEKGIAEAKVNGACVPYEKAFIHKDGHSVPVLVGYVLLGEEREEAVGFILNLSDRQLAAAEQQKFVSLIENSTEFIGIASLEGQVTYLNDAGQKLVGLKSLADIKQTAASDYIMPDDKAYFQENIIPTVIAQGHWQGEFRLQNFQTGEPIPVDFHAFTIKDKNTGQPTALATVTRDIRNQKQAEAKILKLNQDLQRHIDELQTLLEVIPIGIGIAEDPECQTIKVNTSFAKQLQISPDTNASLTAPIEERPTTFKVYREGRELLPEELPMQYAAAHGVEVIDFDVDVIHEDGRVVNLLESVAPLFDEEGHTRGCIGTFLDITVRKQVEFVLRNHQKWLEDVLNLMPMPLLFIEPGTARVTFANRAADEFAGGEFPQGKPAAEYHTVYRLMDKLGSPIPNDMMPGVRVARGERLEGLEMDWHTCSGIRSVLIFADTLPAMHGYPATCVLVFQDVTNLKRVETALSLGYNRLQLLFDTANDLLSSQQPVALIDSVFRKLSVQIGLDVYFNYLVEDNSQTMRLASYRGISQELATEIEWLEFGQAVCGTVAQEQRPMAVENVQQSTDPKTQLIRGLGVTSYYCYPLIAQGRLLGTLSFGSRSLTHFSENQKGMMQAVCDQIAIAMERASLIASLQQQTEQMRQANRMKDEFLAILSHELRSPLNAILGWAQLLRTRKFGEAQTAKGLETIERNARVQTQLIEDLLDISRMIRGQLRLNVRTCNLMPIIESAIETVNLAAQAKEIDLQFILWQSPTPQNPDLEGVNSQDGELGMSQSQICASSDGAFLREGKDANSQFLLNADAERLQQIIWNLLSNAIKFTAIGGKVEIRVSQITAESLELTGNGNKHLLPNYAQIQVIDTGIGINPNFLPYVFDRFRQADSSSTRAHGGLGLGLAIVRHLVELHGGTVHVDSPGEGKGSTFTVNLPLLLPTRQGIWKPEPRKQAEFAPAQDCISLLGVRVLVVDDEADSREFMTTVLEECQAEVQVVASVAEALQVIAHWKPDVLVSDIGMPEEDGYSLIRKLRSLPPEQGGKIPAAALTAYARPEDRMRAIQAGYQLHLPKPIEPAELTTVVASLVTRN